MRSDLGEEFKGSDLDIFIFEVPIKLQVWMSNNKWDSKSSVKGKNPGIHSESSACR